MNRRIEWHEEVTSTFDVAVKRAREGAPHMTVVAAARQTAGRGRHGRVWESPPGALCLTVILRPQSATMDTLPPSLCLLPAVPIAQVIERICNSQVTIRWPNDLYADNRKLAGLLIEAHWQGARMEYCLLGVGINVNVRLEDLSEEVRARATSMTALCGRPLEVPEVLDQVVEAVASAWTFTPEIPSLDAVRARCSTLRHDVQVTRDDGTILHGRAVDIGPHGELVVETEDGRETVSNCREVRVSA